MSDSRDVSRQTFVLGASAVVAMTATPATFAGSLPDDDAAQLLKLSAGEAVARMSRGEITAERYASVLLARCESLRALNAFITMEPARVLEAARTRDRQRRDGATTG